MRRIAERRPDGDGYPRFVEREFRRCLDCGLLCHGFARLRYPRCGFERLVAFSCKDKICPSCLARRAADTAAWLIDDRLPEAGYRQWVLTFPWTLRVRLAADRPLLNKLLGQFLGIRFTCSAGVAGTWESATATAERSPPCSASGER
ncbi:MAG: hypothetical protein GF346_06985 [Candidatus Eisenbacteria bacterium]|nr:hypothetical protein [Candidatus Latescibacterota bacterium]MBD3302174.1 hypothetical protein [Candidatus Eisenbacteria bacterium]